MRFKTWVLTALLAFPLFGYQVGDTVSFYLNKFLLILSRDTIPQVGVIRAEGDHCFIVTADRVAVSKIGVIAGQMWAATKRLGEEPPAYVYVSDDGVNWDWNRGLSGPDLSADSRQPPAGDLIVNPDMSVYDFFSVPDQSGVIQFVMYAATSDGIFRATSQNPGAWESQAFMDTVVYDLARNPYTSDNFLSGLVLYAATDSGPFRVETQGPNHAASYVPLGEGLERTPVYAIEVLPDDTSRIFAGTDQGLYVKNGTQWTPISDVPAGKVNHIIYDSTYNRLFVTGAFGLYVSEDLGTTWQAKFTDGEVEDVLVLSDNSYLIALRGEGVYRTDDDGASWTDFSAGLEVLAALGSKNVYTLYRHEDGTLYLGCDEGVYRYDEAQQQWVNVSNGIGSLITDESVGDVLAAFEDPLGDGESAYEKILNALNLQPTDLVDVDGEKLFIVLTRLIQTTNATDPTVTPVYGYFDPADEDLFSPTSSKKELFVVDLSRFLTMGEDGPAKMRAFLAYLMGRYAIWSIDPQESPAINTGLAAWAAYKAGFDFADGISGGYDYLNDKAKLNVPLLDYTHQWLNSPVAREIDRERMFLFMEYLSERYGDETVVQGIAHNLRDEGYALVDGVIRTASQGADSLWSFLPQWHLANLLGAYEDLEVSVSSDAITSVPGPSETRSVQVLSPAGVAFWRGSASDTTFLRFNGQDDATEFLSTWLVYGDSMAEYVPLDSLARFQKLLDGTQQSISYKFMVVSLNPSKTYSYYVTEDVTPPTVIGVYTLPNPGHPWVLNLYLAGYDKVGGGFYPLYTDVTVEQPTVYLTSLSDGTQENYLTTKLSQGDSVFLYGVVVNTALRGDVAVDVWVQDRAGNAAIVPPDTLNIQTVDREGAHYLALGGAVEVEIPAGALSTSRTLVIDRVRPEVLAGQVPGVEESRSPVFVVGSPSIPLAKPVTLRFRVAEGSTQQSIYRFDGTTWTPVPTWYDPETHTYGVTTDRLGLFQVRSGSSETLKFAVRLESGTLVRMGSGLRFSVVLPEGTALKAGIYDVSGARVATLAQGTFAPGTYTFHWQPKVASGVYFLNVEAGNHRSSHKLIVLR